MKTLTIRFLENGYLLAFEDDEKNLKVRYALESKATVLKTVERHLEREGNDL